MELFELFFFSFVGFLCSLMSVVWWYCVLINLYFFIKDGSVCFGGYGFIGVVGLVIFQCCSL